MSILDRMKKSSSVSSDILKNSRFFGNDVFIDTGNPILNLALSAKLDGGLAKGLTIFAGPSKHFKSAYLCILMAAYQRKYEDGLVVFYDSEFGSKPSYFTNFGVDIERVLHVPIMDIEELKFDIMKKLEELTESDHVMIALDSIGNLASKKEVEDALAGSDKADMTRAKQFKSLGRMITPYLTMKDIPAVAVNHSYQTMEMFSKQVMGGGTGLMYSADNVFFVNKVQDTDKALKEVVGYDFDLTVEKSRFVKEKRRLPIHVSFEGGVSKYSGIFDLGLKLEFIKSPNQGWYTIGGVDKKHRKKDLIDNVELMEELLTNEDFKKAVQDEYAL